MTLLATPLRPAVEAALADQLDELDQRLAAHQRRLLAELHTLTVDSDLSDLLDDDVAAGDGTERETTWLLARHVREQRAEIAAARQRLADGTYGHCTSCGSTISTERLEILPATQTCVLCAR